MQFNAITIDPPWRYERDNGQGVAAKQYDLMSWDDLAAIGPLLHAVAAPDCAIFLWTCAPLLIETVELVRAWKLRYITKAFCWLKIYGNGGFHLGLGSHTRGNTEDVWLLSNGAPRRRATDVPQVLPTLEDDALIALIGRHSQKPEESHRRIERMYAPPYLEIFARKRCPGWTCIGYDLDGLDVRESLARLHTDQSLPAVELAVTQGILL